jgi:hypothetical protein
MKIGSLFSGVGGFELGFEKAGLGHPVFQIELDAQARTVLAEHWPDVPRFEDVCAVNAHTLPACDVLCGGYPCFVAGTPIHTDQGYLPIEDVREGMRVLTHKRRWRPVVATMRRDGAETLTVRAYGCLPVVTTEEHPFWVRKRSYGYPKGKRMRQFSEPEWVDAKDLDRDCYVGMPIAPSEQESTHTEAFAREAFIENGYCWVPVRSVEKNKVLSRVYNFEVEGDNSYVAQGIAVHNCQDLSDSATGWSRPGLEGKRSGLWWEYDRLIGELNPKWVAVENVDGAAWKRWVPVVRRALWRRGYASVPLCVRACDVGAPFKGSRVFVVATSDRHCQSTLAQYAKVEVLQELANTCRQDWGKPSPEALGVPHGIPRRMDRLRLLGNAIVPACAHLVGKVILSVDSAQQ